MNLFFIQHAVHAPNIEQTNTSSSDKQQISNSPGNIIDGSILAQLLKQEDSSRADLEKECLGGIYRQFFGCIEDKIHLYTTNCTDARLLTEAEDIRQVIANKQDEAFNKISKIYTVFTDENTDLRRQNRNNKQDELFNKIIQFSTVLTLLKTNYLNDLSKAEEIARDSLYSDEINEFNILCSRIYELMKDIVILTFREIPSANNASNNSVSFHFSATKPKVI